MQTVHAGPLLLELIKYCYRADLPVLLRGVHGIGKSTLVSAAAKAMGIHCHVLDLSLMEPPDLVGIPRVNEAGDTVYAPPAMLPRSGKGILMIEELNRCPRFMQAPCFELLTSRRLNAYDLPSGWLPCAAINDGEGYFADELDPALLSRFLNVTVVADVPSWVAWAQAAGVHNKVIEFVRNSPGIFTDPQSNPRTWDYVSRFLSFWEQQGERNYDLLAAAAAGFVGDKWAVAFIRVYSNLLQPLEAEEIVKNYSQHRHLLRSWVKQRSLDVVVASLEKLKQFLQPQFAYEAVIDEPASKTNVQDFFADLPPDIQVQVREWLKDRGFDRLTVNKRTRGNRHD